MWQSGSVHGAVMRARALFPYIPIQRALKDPYILYFDESAPMEMTMKEWLKPEITESEAGMEVTSYLPAELGRA
jgi:coenzyme PQQ precursor peptide PqqA